MPPNQYQYPAPPPSPGEPGHDPYAFFMDPAHQPKKGLFNFGGGSSNKVLIIAAVLAALIVVLIVASLLSSGGKKQSQGLLSLAQTQQEVIRVATDGTKNAQSTELKNFATNAEVSLSSDQRLFTDQLAKEGIKFKTKELELGKSAQTDQALAAAQAANTYDVTFASTMDSELDTYQSKLEETAKGATSTAGKTLLQQEIDHAASLRKQVQANIKP